MLVSLSEMVCIVRRRRRRRAMGSQGGRRLYSIRKEGDNKRAWLHFYLLASPLQSFQVNRVGNYTITTEEKIINWRIQISNLVSTSHYGHWLISTRGRTNSSVTTSRFFFMAWTREFIRHCTVLVNNQSLKLGRNLPYQPDRPGRIQQRPCRRVRPPKRLK